MNSHGFSINEFNRTMHEDISKQKLNFCKAVILSDRKISITVKHEPHRFHSEYATLNPDLSIKYESDFAQFYYGVSPVIDSYLIIDAISSLSFSTTADLEKFISAYCSHFMLHKEQAELLPDMAKLILLTVASKYGIKLKLCDQLGFLDESRDLFCEIVDTDREKGIIRLHGCPTSEILELLSSFRFVKKNGIWELNENGTGIKDIYADKENIELLVGKVFYSGVLLKPMEIVKQKFNHENDVSNIIILYERSTFAAVCAFDDNRIQHPLLDGSLDALKNMFVKDDEYKQELDRQLSDNSITDDGIIACVNDYMQKSFNVNQIGISSNVRTSDEQIFFGLRGAGNIDGGCLYPGINGNAEVYDPNVSAYNNSVYEDLPSIYINDHRSDLQGEIGREAYGELRLNAKKESWECYGMIISGNMPRTAGYSSDARRCHFNVLFENEVEYSLEKIAERKLKANESFENQSFAGIRIRCYKNRPHRISSGFISLCRKLLSSKDFIESLLLLSLAFVNVRITSLSLDSLSSVFSYIFAGLILLTNVIHLVKVAVRWHKKLKITKTINIYESMTYPDLCRIVSEAMGNQYHPAAYASLKMHVENIIYSRMNKD